MLKYHTAILFSLLSVIGIFLIFGFFWEDWQGFLVFVGYGLISTPPSHELLFQDLLFLQLPLIIHLSSLLEKIPVFGIWSLTIIVLYLSLWFHLSNHILGKIIKNSALFLIATSLLLVWAIIGISLVYVNVTRDSILLVSSSTLLYFYYYICEGKKSWLLILLTLLGVSMRVTSGIAALVAMSLLSLLLFRDFKKVFNLLKIQWVVSIVFLLIVQGNYQGANSYERKIEHNEYPIMGGALVPMSEMRSKYDSMRYEALSVYFLVTDTAKINLEFIDKVVDIHKYQKMEMTNSFFHSLDTIIPLISDYRYFILIFYILLVIVAWYSPGMAITNIILYNLGCWLVVLILAMKVTMQNHFFIPWVSMTFAGGLFFIIQQEKKLQTWQRIVSFICILLMTITVFNKLNIDSKEEKRCNERSYVYIKNIERLSANRLIVIWNHYPQFPNEVLGRNESSVFKKCVDLSLYTIQFYKFGQDRCVKKLGANPLDWKSMNIALNLNKDKIAFITEDSSADFLKEYYKTIYNLDFNLVKDSPVTEIGQGLYSFHLKESEKN